MAGVESRKEKREWMSPVQVAKIRCFNEIKSRGGMTPEELVDLGNNQEFMSSLGASVSPIETANHYLTLGFLDFHWDSGKYVPANLEKRAHERALQAHDRAVVTIREAQKDLLDTSSLIG